MAKKKTKAKPRPEHKIILGLKQAIEHASTEWQQVRPPYSARHRTELDDYRQAAQVEANLKREFLARAEAAESAGKLTSSRIEWIRSRHEKQLADYHFANGFRAGLQCALLALDGRDVLGNSIDATDAKSE